VGQLRLQALHTPGHTLGHMRLTGWAATWPDGWVPGSARVCRTSALRP
jgi:hypothetical protein